MNRWIRRSAITAAALVALAAATVFAGEQLALARAARQVDVAVQPVAFRDDAGAVERGRYLYQSRGCVDCHGHAGGGRTLVEDADAGLHIAGPNLTSGNPRVAAYGQADWVRAIRHGVGPGGRPLRVMPSEDYNRLTDADLAALVAHLRQLPPQAGRVDAVVQLPLPARVLYGLGLIDDAAAKIDHTQPPSQPVPEGVSVAHGHYVAQMCIGCHGAQLDGGRIAGAPPDWPAAAKLSPGAGSAMARYRDAATFEAMMKTGLRPDGTRIGVMPFESLAHMSAVDTQALFVYLSSLQPAQPVAATR
jgi:mono/diheme cytochrome c family protein